MTDTLRKFGRWIGDTVDTWVGRMIRGVSRQPERFRRKAPGYPAFLWRIFKWSSGSSTPLRMVLAAVAFIAVSWAIAVVVPAVGLPLVAFFTASLVVGLLRHIPVVDRGFVELRSSLIP